MYYLIFSYYEDLNRTHKIQDVFFETNDSYVGLKMLEFFDYIEYKQFNKRKSNYNYRKLSYIYFINVWESSTIEKQLDNLRNSIDDPSIDIITRREVKRFLKFLKHLIKLLDDPDTRFCDLEIFSVEGNLPIDC